MTTQRRPYVDFREVKRAVSLPEVLDALGVLNHFEQRGETLAGTCPLPQHQHGPYPNPQQFKAKVRDGIWQWYCHGDCKRGGDVVEFVKLTTGLDDAHVRLWFAERFGDRLRLSKPKRNGDGRSSKPPKEEARPVPQTPERAECSNSEDTVSSEAPPIKPLRFKLKLQAPVPYLRQRGVDDATAERYGLGLCTKGLLAGYVAIPVFRQPPDENPVAYLGRWPGEDFDEASGRPRYKWPGGFPKQRIVYGLAEALETPGDRPLIVVEGPFSVYHLVQAGFASSVAVFGSSMSDEQAAQLIGTRRPIVLFFDGDAAGQAGMRKAAGKLIIGAFVRVARLAAGQQPDDLSPADLASVLSDAA